MRACSGVSCVVGMSDELPPPPVSKTRASQIALNFAGRVKHQMKDERKQVAWLPCPTASTTASPPGLLGHTPSHPHCPARGSGPRSTRSSRRRQCARWRSSCAGAAELTSCCHSPLTTPARGVYYLTTRYYSPRAATCHSPLTVRTLPCSEDKKLTKDKEKGDADRILRRYAITYCHHAYSGGRARGGTL